MSGGGGEASGKLNLNQDSDSSILKLPNEGNTIVATQNTAQGLVHWMSAVMAEHMTSNSHHHHHLNHQLHHHHHPSHHHHHHDPGVGMHYMWNTQQQQQQQLNDVS